MSLPAELRQWAQCPKCNECQDLKRLGPIGVKGTPDSKLVRCGFCETVFRSDMGTMLENMGRDTEGNYAQW